MSPTIAALLLVAAGGFLGGVARWSLTRLLPAHPATLAANVIGSVVLGVAVGSPGVIPLIVGTGVAGALSTWSSFANQLAELVEKRRWWEFTRYLLLTLALCVVAVWRGTIWAQRIWVY